MTARDLSIVTLWAVIDRPLEIGHFSRGAAIQF